MTLSDSKSFVKGIRTVGKSVGGRHVCGGIPDTYRARDAIHNTLEGCSVVTPAPGSGLSITLPRKGSGLANDQCAAW